MQPEDRGVPGSVGRDPLEPVEAHDGKRLEALELRRGLRCLEVEICGRPPAFAGRGAGCLEQMRLAGTPPAPQPEHARRHRAAQQIDQLSVWAGDKTVEAGSLGKPHSEGQLLHGFSPP